MSKINRVQKIPLSDYGSREIEIPDCTLFDLDIMEIITAILVVVVVVLIMWNINLTIRLEKLELKEYDTDREDTPGDRKAD